VAEKLLYSVAKFDTYRTAFLLVIAALFV